MTVLGQLPVFVVSAMTTGEHRLLLSPQSKHIIVVLAAPPFQQIDPSRRQVSAPSRKMRVMDGVSSRNCGDWQTTPSTSMPLQLSLWLPSIMGTLAAYHQIFAIAIGEWRALPAATASTYRRLPKNRAPAAAGEGVQRAQLACLEFGESGSPVESFQHPYFRRW